MAPLSAGSALSVIASGGSAVREWPPVAWLRRLGLKGIVALIAGGMVAWMLPWVGYLGNTLPSIALAHNWAAAWIGLDLGIAAFAAATVWLIRRHDPRSALTAVAGAALLAMDSWFDICTSAPGAGKMLAIGLGVGLNLPLAAGAVWFAVRTLGRALAVAQKDVGAAGDRSQTPVPTR
ncbi:hypothetical protein G4X40_04540 [Rhodococcus sp. D2-41]|uniref:Uncharacterized protein n=1 Tax=Speluncibacter jeojiensis TaxID=2710754 RepID=A0A9X4M6M3_9ACTN|nr:hypothetical protein [Rhodococcus sp. D2-41]MDG3009411.1 hypothetical protein [Rhodococcus sp. D2-41]MDG3016962.1 hypothetical protein [Corynebacteriales bacterium D3-21]